MEYESNLTNFFYFSHLLGGTGRGSRHPQVVVNRKDKFVTEYFIGGVQDVFIMY